MWVTFPRCPEKIYPEAAFLSGGAQLPSHAGEFCDAVFAKWQGKAHNAED